MKEKLSPDLENCLKTFHENNFDVFDWMDESNPPPEHLICFNGDFPDEGFRAAELAIQLGYEIFQLRYIWDYDARVHEPDGFEGPCWELSLMPLSQ